MKKLLILLLSLLFTFNLFSQISEGQPIPESSMEKALNQYTHLCINTIDQVIDYKPESHLKLGGFGSNYVEYFLTEELDHFGINLIPLGVSNNANLKIELTLESQIYGFEFDGFGNLKDLSGNNISNAFTVSEKEPIILGIDDGHIILEINGNLIYSQKIEESTLGAKIKLTTINAIDECFWFFVDASYRRALGYVNFVESEIFINENENGAVCIDLTKSNIGEAAVFRISLLPAETPHFDNFQPVDLTIASGNIGEVCFELFTDEGNQIKDVNKNYFFELEVISGTHIGVGDKNVLKVKVIDDFLPFENSLVPGDLMFTGFESDIGDGDDQIIITNLAPLTPGTSFQLTNANYNAEGNKFYGRTYSGFSSIQFIYTGDTILPPNTTFCIFTGTHVGLLGTNIKRIEINGVDETSLFKISNVGNAAGKILELSNTASKSLFVLQGQWAFDNAKFGMLNGKVIAGIHIGGFWSLDQTPLPTFSNEHPDLECLGVQGPTNVDLHWAYYQCESPFTTSIFDLKKNLSDFTEWVSGADNEGQYSLPSGICISTCIINDNHIPLTWNVTPQDLTVTCNGTTNPNGEISTWLSSLGNGTYVGSCSNIITSNNYTAINANNCGEYEVIFNVTANDCQEEINSSATITVIDNVPPTFTNIPAIDTVGCYETDNISLYGAIDSCSLTEDILFAYTESFSSSNANYDIFERVFVAEDNCGNQSNFIQTKYVSRNDVSAYINLLDGYFFCENDELLISANVQGQTGSVTYNWKYFDENNNLILSSTNTSFLIDDNEPKPSGRIELTVTDGSCVAVDEVSVVGSTFNLGQEYIDIIVCENEGYIITPIPENNMGAVNYEWYIADIDRFLHDNSTFEWDNSQERSLYVIATDENSCTFKQYWQIDEKVIDIIFEDVNGDELSSVLNACSGDEIELVSSIEYDGSNSGFIPSYKWKKGSSLISTNDYVIVAPTTTTTYVLEVEIEGCIEQKEITIQIDPVNIGIPNTVEFCENSPFIIESNVTGGHGDKLYEWYRIENNIEVYVGFDPSLDFNILQDEFNSPITPVNSQVFRLYVYDIFERFDAEDEYPIYSGTGKYCVYTKDFTVFPTPAPMDVMITGEMELCFGESESYSTNYYNQDAIHTWYFNGIQVGGQSPYLLFSPQESGILEVIVNIDGCVLLDEISINVNDVVSASDGKEYCLCNQIFSNGGGFDILDITFGPFNFSQEFYLDFLPQNISDELDIFINGIKTDSTGCINESQDEEYYVINVSENDLLRIYVNGYCSNDTTTRWDFVMSCDSTNLQLNNLNVQNRTEDSHFSKEHFKVYPNPAYEKFILEYWSVSKQDANFQLFTMSGELIKSSEIHLKEGQNLTSINTQDLFSGVYLVRLRTSDQEFIEKLIIVK